MLGRRLDRYIGLFFVWHFVLSLLAIVILYVIIDTFAKLDDFIGQEDVIDSLRWIVTYHAYQTPVLLTQFLPLVTLLAAVVSIARLSRYNELNAIKAVGVSLHRTVVPVLLVSLVIGALGAANQEFLVPSLAQDIMGVRMAMRQRDTYYDLSVFDRSNKTTVWVRRFEYAVPGFELTGVEVSPRAAAAQAKHATPCRIRNASGVWVRHWIFLTEGEVLGSNGTWKPLKHKSLVARSDSLTFTMPRDPGGSDGEPAVRLQAECDRRPVQVTFAACKYKGALRLITGAQLTAPIRGAEPSAPIAVQAALWRDHRWLGRATTYQARDMGRDEILYDGAPLPFDVPPHDLIKSDADPTLKSFRELLTYTDAPPALRQKVLVVLHSRMAFPLASFVLLLVAIPLLFQQEGGKSTWVGMGLALLASLAFYFVNYTCQFAGQNAEGVFAGVPALAAWLPLLLFSAMGVVLLARMET